MVAIILPPLSAHWASAQGFPGAGEYQAYSLRYARVAEVEVQLRRLLAALESPTDLVIDTAQNRVLLRGDATAQQMVQQTLAALDRFQEPLPVGPVLRAYAVAPEHLIALAVQLERELAGQPDVRIGSDPRSNQLLIVAPLAIHNQLANRLGVAGVLPGPAATPVASNPASAVPPLAAMPPMTPPGPALGPEPMARMREPSPGAAAQAPPAAMAPAASMPPDAPAPTVRQQFMLAHTQWQQIHAQLGQLYGQRLEAMNAPQGDTLVCQLVLAGQAPLVMLGSPQGHEVALIGPQTVVERGQRLLTALDQLALGGANRQWVVPVAGVPHPTLQRAIAAVHSINAGEAPAARGRVPLVAQLFQAQAPAAAQPNAQPDAVGPEAEPDGESGLIGPVQIEFLDGLDVMIISGNARDVERVVRIIEDIERLSVETVPAIEVYHLQHVGSEAVSTIITQLYDQVLATRQGRVSITPLVKPNALLLIGREESVRTIIDLVERLDQPVDPNSQFAVFPLKRAPAAAVQTTLQEFFANRAGLGGRATVTIDFRSNSLIVQASPRDLAEAAELIRRIDTSTSEAVNQLQVFPLKNSLAEELAAVLQAAISGQPGTDRPGVLPFGPQPAPGAQTGAAATQQQAQQQRSTMLQFLTIDAEGQRRLSSGILTEVTITADPRANALLVSAPPESMELIQALIAQLDQIPAAQSQIKVFTIINGDAASLRDMLQNLFGQATQPGGFGAAAAAAIAGENLLVPLRFSVDERTNSVIASGSVDDLRVVEAILLRLDESDARQRKSIVYRLKNAPAIDVANSINQFLTSQREVQQISPQSVSPFQQIEREVVVVPEPVSNSLIVSATPRYFEEIRELVDELDARPPMVMIQVLIAEVTLNNTEEFGVELGVQDGLLFDRSLLGDLITTTDSTQLNQNGAIQTTTNQVIQGATLTPGFGWNNQPLGNSGSDLSRSTSAKVGKQALTNFAVGRVNGELGYGGMVLSASSESLSLLIRALKECRRLDVLSRPQIMTLDNQPAFIQVGSRVPRVRGVTIDQTGQVNNVVDENVGLILGVTPRISPDGLVVMELDAERSALGPESEGVPISISATGEVVRQPVINTTTAQTTISAANGQTVVLAGLITKSRAATRRRVPLLSDIPILGHLFRYDSEAVQRTELLIILTPHVIRTEADAELVRQVESARMSWIISDVRALHGDSAVQARGGEWADAETIVIYPDENPTAMEIVPPPSVKLAPQTAPSPVPDTPDEPLQFLPAEELPDKQREADSGQRSGIFSRSRWWK